MDKAAPSPHASPLHAEPWGELPAPPPPQQCAGVGWWGDLTSELLAMGAQSAGLRSPPALLCWRGTHWGCALQGDTKNDTWIFVLAVLLYHFDWELPDGGRPEELDMSEAFGLAIRRKSKLVLRATQRIPVAN